MIYTDEAGTGPAEPVRVVASVIVDGDNDWRKLDSEISRITKSSVPKCYQDNFWFHGKDIFNGSKLYDRSVWSFDDRLDLFREFLCLPFVYDVPISLGVVFNGYLNLKDLAKESKFRVHQLEHLIAFQYCVERADLFLRKYLNGLEIGTVVAEDVESYRRLLSKAGLFYRENPIEIPGSNQSPEYWRRALNIPSESVVYEINNIIDIPHFVEKKRAPLLQLSDACAFAFRRCLSKQTHGDELVLAMLGPDAGRDFINDEVWFSGISSGLFNTYSYWSADQKREQAQINHALAGLGS